MAVKQYCAFLLATTSIITLTRHKLHLDNHELDLSDSEKTQLFVQGGLYSIMALISLFGFIGCLSRKRALVSIYCWTSYALLAISVITGAIFLVNLYRQDTSQTVKNCINNVNNKTGTDEDITDQVCEKGTKILTTGARVAVTVILVIFWSIQACAYPQFRLLIPSHFDLFRLQTAATSFIPTFISWRKRRMPRCALLRHLRWPSMSALALSPHTTPSTLLRTPTARFKGRQGERSKDIRYFVFVYSGSEL